MDSSGGLHHHEVLWWQYMNNSSPPVTDLTVAGIEDVFIVSEILLLSLGLMQKLFK